MDEQRSRNGDVEKEMERWRQFPAREREKDGSSRPRALLIKLSTRLSTPIRLPCFVSARDPANFGWRPLYKYICVEHARTFHLDVDGYFLFYFVRSTLFLVSIPSFFEARCLPELEINRFVHGSREWLI